MAHKVSSAGSKKAFFAVFCSFALLFASGCGTGFGKKEIPLARVDKYTITDWQAGLKAKLYNLTINNEDDAEKLLNMLINNYLILEQAKRDNISVNSKELDEEIKNFVPDSSMPDIKKTLKSAGIKYGDWKHDINDKLLIKKEINFVVKANVKIKEEELKDYFWVHILDYRRADRVHVRQILVDSEEKAKAILENIKSGVDFATLAQKYSTASEAKNGGDLGYFSRSEMPAFITNAVFALKKGEVSGVVKSDYGYHIFKCDDIQKADTPKFEEVRDEVYQTYFELKKDEFFSGWMEELRKNAKIEIIKENLKEFIQEEKT